MKTCRIQISTTCKPRDVPRLSGESSEGGEKKEINKKHEY